MILWSRASLSDVNHGIFILLCLHNNVVLDSKVCFYLTSQASNQSGLFHRSIVVTLPIGIWIVAVAHLTERSLPIPYCRLFESYYLWLQRFKILLKHFLSKFLPNLQFLKRAKETFLRQKSEKTKIRIKYFFYSHEI